jgi:hypothetical protein
MLLSRSRMGCAFTEANIVGCVVYIFVRTNDNVTHPSPLQPSACTIIANAAAGLP